MTEATIALGSNLGDRRATVALALKAIEVLPGSRILAQSTLIETEPVGPVQQGMYLNGVVRIETVLDARTLLTALLAIESDLGRDRSSAQRWGPRTLDLDLLLFGNAQIDEPGLCVPHPRLTQRRFVLEPLAEIAPDLDVPGTGRTVRELLQELNSTEGTRCS